MTTVSYTYDLDDDVAFVSTKGVKRGIVKAINISIVPGTIGPTSTSITYEIEVKNIGDSKTHLESAHEIMVTDTLDNAWALFQAAAS